MLSKFTSKIEDLSGYTKLEQDVESDEKPIVEFSCKTELYGSIAEPRPANNALPEWYKNLEGKIGDGLKKSTVKRCAPFLDAMTAGWIIPFPGEIEIESTPGDWGATWGMDERLIGSHSDDQIGNILDTDENIFKFNNLWTIKVPDGYSMLFVPPLNRQEPRFQQFSGIVDCDRYFNRINFPSVWTGGTYHDVIEAGEPMMQAIPIKRDSMLNEALTRPMTEDEELEAARTKTESDAQESMYRENRWAPKQGTRMVQTDE